MRQITQLVVHCTATPEGREVTVADIDRWHRELGWRCIGYHWVVYLDGSIHAGRPEEQQGAHVAGHNVNSIGIVYVGGVDLQNKAKDTRTEAQKRALADKLHEMLLRYPGCEVLGHRDFPNVHKDCPCFDVKSWWASVQQIQFEEA